jgi:NAD(P)-dependent dehydrogenase (short-subunit alcohol dehydrogenase family)
VSAGVTISFTGKRALVTGGANGLGAAIVQRLAEAGATGVSIDLTATGTALAGWHSLAADVRSEDQIERACQAAVEQLGGPLDLLVLAAGIVPPWRHVAELDLSEWDDLFAINVRGVAATLKHAAPLMSDGGAVIVIGSLNSWRGDGNITGYVASKHAVLGIVRSAAIDLGSRGIRVNAIGPGPVATEALRGRMAQRARSGGPELDEALKAAAAMTSLGRIATSDDVAGTALFLASDLAGAITGQLLPVDGGLP